MAVTQDDLRSVIRELLAEELAAIQGEAATPPPAVRAEEVSIDTDDALGAFVKRILELAADDKARAEIEQGRHVFRLAPGAQTAAPSARLTPRAAPARLALPALHEQRLPRSDRVQHAIGGELRVLVARGVDQRARQQAL